jgi:hypothetical protein
MGSYTIFSILLFCCLISPSYSQLLNSSRPVKGFVDVHNHMMAEYAFAGAWLHGPHSAPEHIAMKACSGNFNHSYYAKTTLSPVNELLATILGQKSQIIDELKAFGVDTKNLESSSENFIKMWEKTYHQR